MGCNGFIPCYCPNGSQLYKTPLIVTCYFHLVIEKCGNDYYLRDKIDRLCYIIKVYTLVVSGHNADTISVKVANVGSVV